MFDSLIRRPRTLATIGLIAVAAPLALSGCAGPAPMHAADDANNPACAEVIVRLPDTVADLQKRATNAQSTGAWGNPADVELRCGVETSGPTTDMCVNVNDVDWIIDESQAPLYRFEAYGREPGLEVYVNGDKVSGTSVVTDLAAVAKQLPQVRECTGYADSMAIANDK
ncbi:DUF3515 family protein [Leucobacter sp. CX328]|uniref:DUF3515 family protein n=1 Tax=unclassified Leucobacter TaxID=2621730 RepID=UPI003342A2B4